MTVRASAQVVQAVLRGRRFVAERVGDIVAVLTAWVLLALLVHSAAVERSLREVCVPLDQRVRGITVTPVVLVISCVLVGRILDLTVNLELESLPLIRTFLWTRAVADGRPAVVLLVRKVRVAVEVHLEVIIAGLRQVREVDHIVGHLSIPFRVLPTTFVVRPNDVLVARMAHVVLRGEAVAVAQVAVARLKVTTSVRLAAWDVVVENLALLLLGLSKCLDHIVHFLATGINISSILARVAGVGLSRRA